LIAYSSIANLALSFLALSLGAFNGYFSLIFIYFASNLLILILILNGYGPYLNILKALSGIAALSIINMASIPPFPLFLAKWLLLLDILNIGYYTIAIIIIMVSLLSLIAYLNQSFKYSILTL
jgi:NADH-quinone oxidoreductase subunit N